MQWVPRGLGLSIALFLSIFALDSFDGGSFALDAVPLFLVHLIPSAIVLTVVWLAWRREWIGGLAFIAMAIAYAIAARDHLSWVALISGPLVVAGAMYAWTWRQRSTAA